MTQRSYRLALVLSGGNALGAYQGGAYQALHEAGLDPDRVAAASAGAINGALICGNAPAERVSRLRTFWNVDGDAAAPAEAGWGALEETRRTTVAAATLLAGRPALFTPRNVLGPWWNPFGNDEPASLYDTTPLGLTLERLVDFAVLNRAAPPLSITAVDLGSGEDVVFDTRRDTVTPDHLRASGALLPAFSPVRVGGRLLGDAGIAANLPLDTVLAEESDEPLLCIAVDLLPLAAPLPRTLGDAAARMQDLMFATQSRRAIAAWQAIFDERVRRGEAGAVTILHVAYADQEHEVSGKAFDFSAASAMQRWRSGYHDLRRVAAAIERGDLPLDRPGLAAYRLGERLEPVRWSMAPVPG